MSVTKNGNRPAVGVFSQKQLDEAIRLNTTRATIGDNPDTRVIGVCEVNSFHGALGDFSIILRAGDVAFTSAHVGIIDEAKHFYFGGPEAFGQLSDLGTHLPEEKVFIIIEYEC